MKAYLRTEMPDGSVRAVHVETIARNRAEHYAKNYTGTFEERVEQALLDNVYPLFESDDYEIEDWAANNMNWEDVKNSAIMIAAPQPVDYQEGWVNGAHLIVREAP